MDADPVIKTYPDIGERAFGYKGRALVSIFLYLELYLVAVEFLILEGDNLNKLFPDLISLKLAGLKIGGKRGFILLTALVILPTTWLRSLGMLAYVSAGGVFATFVLLACVIWDGAADGVGFHEGDVLWNWGGLPTAISLFTFCYCGHAVFPILCNSMKDKSQFSKVLLVCFITSTITYALMAVLGYLMYGEYLKSQVTLNLPIRKVSAKIAIYTTLINPLTKYAVVTAPIANAIEDTFRLNSTKPLSILIRTAIMISVLAVALTIPFFGYMMAFIGAFLSISVSMLLPCLCYLRINKAARIFGFELVVIAGILIFGLFVGLAGTYTSLKQIITHL
ncbi:amino acid transporter AVT1I isoform X2 [Ricinus communis]|nr:amino acid transporter AVT1I isoform X2 [Ricinus communis]